MNDSMIANLSNPELARMVTAGGYTPEVCTAMRKEITRRFIELVEKGKLY